MRDILFRGQTRRKGEYIVNMAGDKCESHWVYGGIFPQNKDGDFAIIYQQEPEIRKFTVYADTVGQYTGLTDKNGRKIFEGDIVVFADFFNDEIHRGVVYWCDLAFWFDCTETEGDEGIYSLAYISANILEVIGNTYDNPELLEVKK